MAKENLSRNAGGYEKGKHTQSKEPQKNKQQIACDWVYENYVAFNPTSLAPILL